jgi:ABC-type Fe3+ transport system substrate-binding protein
MARFQTTDTLYKICQEHPEVIPVFVSNGFPQMDDPVKRKEFCQAITLGQALALKGLDSTVFTGLLESALDRSAGLREAGSRHDNLDAIEITGLLPCPVRVPLLEEFESFVTKYTEVTGLKVNYELKAASQGISWMEGRLDGNEDDLPDIFLSAGFDMFFDRQRFGRFREAGVFADLTGWTSDNSLFEGVGLRDPKGEYSVIAAVPAVFLINLDELGSLPVPRRWADLLTPEFEQRVSLPVGDFDLFNAILVNMYKTFGDDGVKKLGRCLLESMHPAQMVKSNRQEGARPIVTIMPNFFTKMVREGSGMEAVWPEDGAITSPIFMLTKKSKASQLQPIVDFFAGKAAGEILSHKGLFPSLNPQVENRMSAGLPFLWPGWDWLDSQDIGAVIRHSMQVFEQTLEEVSA